MLRQEAPIRTGPAPAGGKEDEVGWLHEEFARTGDARLRERLVAHYVPLAKRIAWRYAHRGESIDDLIQVAMLGLLKAVDRFDPQRATRFSTYAVPTIVGELKRHFRDHRWGVRVPRAVQETYLDVRQAKQDLTQPLGRAPSVADVADHLSMTTDQVLEAMEAGGSFRPVPLTEPDSVAERTANPVLAEADAGFEAAEARQVVAPLLAQLPERQQRILDLRFTHHLTQSQIAAQIGVSQMQVCRLLARSLDTMRTLAGVRTQMTPQ